MTEAIFGLVGVVVGGLITGGLQRWDRLTQKRDRRRVAMRLVSRELLDNLVVLRGAARRRRWWSSPQMSLDALARYRTELADLLSDDHWDTLGDAESCIVSMIAEQGVNEAVRADEGPWSRRKMDAEQTSYVHATAEALAASIEEIGIEVPAPMTAEEFEALLQGEDDDDPVSTKPHNG